MGRRQIPRAALNRKLWALVRHLPGGEQTLRDLVAALHQEEGTAKELQGTDEYTSTRRLDDREFRRILNWVELRARPPKRSSPRGNTIYLSTERQLEYIRFMANALEWSNDGLEQFITRQTRGKGVVTQKLATAVIEPMERILKSRRWIFQEDSRGRKWWDPPETKTDPNPNI